MNKQDKEKLRAKSVKELQKELEDKKKELVKAKFKLNQDQLQDVKKPKMLRKQIAVIKTIMTEKQLETEQSETEGKEKSNE